MNSAKILNLERCEGVPILWTLKKWSKMSSWLQNSALVQPRTTSPKFADTPTHPHPNGHLYRSVKRGAELLLRGKRRLEEHRRDPVGVEVVDMVGRRLHEVTAGRVPLGDPHLCCDELFSSP